MPFSLHLLSIASALVAAFDLTLGAVVLRSDSRARVNQVFFLVCLAFSLWAVGFVFLPTAPPEKVWFWFALSAPGWTLSPALILHFALLTTRRGLLTRRGWLLVPLYLPALFYLGQALRGPGHMGVVDFVATPWGWSDVYGPLTVSYAGYFLYFSGFVLLALGLIWVWGRASEADVERRQARTIVVAGLPVLILVAVSGIFLPWLGVRSIPEVAHLLAGIWLLAIARAVARYRLMVPSSSLVAPGILQEMTDGVLTLDREGHIVTANRSACRLLDLDEGDLSGRLLAEVLGRDDVVQALADDLLREGGSGALEVSLAAAGDEAVPAELSSWQVQNELGDPIGLVVMIRDLSERVRSQERLEFASTHDPLTGLPNRSLLDDRLQRALDRARRMKKPFALVTFDLDDFQQVNESLGHRVGDAVLVEVARILARCVRGVDTVCRTGGDEFLILVEDLLDSEDADIVAKRICKELEKPISVAGGSVNLTGSMGISTYPQDGREAETLLNKANLALYSSRERGKGIFQFFSPHMNEAFRRRMEIENGLRKAIAEDEFFLVYQPLVSFHTGEVAGVEALLRWREPAKGVLAPGSFMEVAERFGKIVEIGDWVLRTACRQRKAWQREGFTPGPIAVNISTRQLREEGFVDRVESVLAEAGLEPDLLELEVTESAAMLEADRARETLVRLADLGVRIAVDDFGIGYSSLVRLKLLPMHAVKVDRSLLGNIVDDAKDRALLMAVMSLARNLAVDVVAEGIETVEQLEVLRSFERERQEEFRCDKVQGYLFGRPMVETQLSDLFRRAARREGPFALLSPRPGGGSPDEPSGRLRH